MPLERTDLVFDRVRQAIVVKVYIGFGMARAEAFAFLRDDAAWDADDGRVRRYFFEDDRAGTDFGAFTDRERAEDFGTTGDDDVVANGRMAFSFFLACTT